MLTRAATVMIVGMLLLLTLTYQPSVAGQGVLVAPALSVSISNGNTQVSILLQASQNLTSLDRFFSLPQTKAILVGGNSSAIASLVQGSVRALSPQATISNLRIALTSSPPNDGSVLQWFNISLTFQVSGIQNPENGDQMTDLSWKSFVISSNVTIGGVEVNDIGTAYMQPLGTFLKDLETPALGTFQYRNLVNNRVVTPVGLPSSVLKIQLLNFTRFLPPVDSWQQSYDFSTRSVAWSYAADPNLGLIVQQQNTEPHATTEKSSSGFFYTLKATVSAPERSRAIGNAVLAVFHDTSELLTASIGAVIVAMIVIGTSAFLYERRILPSRAGRKPKR